MMGLLLEKRMFPHFGSYYVILSFLLHVPVLLLWRLPLMQPYTRRADQTACWPLRTHWGGGVWTRPRKSGLRPGVAEEVTERPWPSADLQAELSDLEAPLSFPCPCYVRSVHRSWSGSRFQGHSLERAVCCWDRLGGTWNWTPALQATVLTLKILAAGAGIYSSCSGSRWTS